MADDRFTRRLIVASLFGMFALGMVFAVAALRRPSPRSPVTGSPGIPADSPTLPDSLEPVSADSVAKLNMMGSVPGDGTAVPPDGYPIKGNGRSGIYHVPGGFAYDRTVASVCFQSAEAAQAAGYRASKS